MAVLWLFCDRASSQVTARPCVSLQTGGVMYPGERYGASRRLLDRMRAEVQWQRDRLEFQEWVS